MAREQSPAFQFYPQDFLADDKVLAMNAAARGVYIVLLCHCWLNHTIPSDPAKIRRLALYDGNNWPATWGLVKNCFCPGDGGLIQPRIEREREKQAKFREMKAKAGKAGGKQTQSRRQARGQAESSPPSSSSSSSSISDPNNKLRGAPVFLPPAATTTSRANGNGHEKADPIAERAGRFVERFGELFLELRHGARYHSKPSVDFQIALQLVETWTDDAWLERLVRVFLKTDDEWVSKGPRSIAVFAARASWCDDRLREAILQREQRQS